jgi:hypothetical protein
MTTASEVWRNVMAARRRTPTPPPRPGGRACRRRPPTAAPPGPPTPAQRAGCSECGAEWNIRDPAGGCPCVLAGRSPAPWPPPPADWQPGEF